MTTPSSTEMFGSLVQDELVSGFLSNPEPEPESTTWSPQTDDEEVLKPEDKAEA